MLEQVKVFSHGPTVLSMKAGGIKIKLMEKAELSMPMVMFKKAHGKKIKRMVTEFTIMRMEQCIKATGLMIISMARD